MTDKEISSVDSLKASFKSGVPPMPEAFSHLIDEAYKVYEIIDGDKRDSPTAGLKRDDKGKLALNTHHSGGLNLDQRALALSLKPEGGLSFDGGRRLKLDADRQVQFADFFSLSRWERMEIAQLLGLKRSTSTTMTRIVSPSPKENERFGTSVSLNAAGDCLVVGMGKVLYLYMSRKGEWNTSTPIVFEAYGDKYRSASWSVSLDAEGDNLAVGYSTPIDTQTMEVCLYMRTNGVWDTKNPIVFPIKNSYRNNNVNVSLSAAGDCLVVVGNGSQLYVYTRTNGIWDRESPIKLYFSSYGNVAMICLSASGNCLAVHGTAANYPSPAINMVYVYTRTNGTWDESYIRFNPPKDSSPGFGKVFSLNAEGDRLAVGADDDSPIINGKVYLYTRTNGIWDTQNPIKFSAPASGVTYFGCAIKLNDAGDRLAVGAASRVYVYTYLNGKWNMETPIEILDPSGNLDNVNGFGKAVSLNKLGTSLAVGAVLTKVDSAPEAGAVYTFENVK
ncbi:hypothetical protein [Photorhabdus cinerea]|uniref:Uncharacterized protein n=1 Tax=Photorhabdus cinerea TaxID=471575 RepID=A0A7X5QEI1_9GAMM|nr:hypothetical protein [Photorhabdus cinerea]NHB92860.1 hypothetical protein [Photorhabdus cinerea]